MNQKKAKALRKGIGFHPADKRQYDSDKPSHRVGRDMQGKPTLHVVTGTIRCTAARQQYQKVKRTSGLAARVLGGA